MVDEVIDKKQEEQVNQEQPMEKKEVVQEKPVEKKEEPVVKKKAESKKKNESTEIKVDPRIWNTIGFAHMTEKSINLIERENKIAFIVNRKSNKQLIKKAFENAFDVKIDKINILIDQKGRKKAFIKLNEKYIASDVAMKLGMI